MEAVVLAGGLGTRLRAVVPDLPKPMAPVAGRPFLEILLGSLAAKGVRRVVMSLGYRAELITSHFGTTYAGMALAHEVETTPLGTGGALQRALARCEGDAALVINGDTFLDLDIAAAWSRWREGGHALIVGKRVEDAARYGRLLVDGRRLVGFAEKGLAAPALINTGHYVLPRTLFDACSLEAPFSFESDFLQPRAAGQAIDVFETDGLFIDIGVPDDYAAAQQLLARWA